MTSLAPHRHRHRLSRCIAALLFLLSSLVALLLLVAFVSPAEARHRRERHVAKLGPNVARQGSLVQIRGRLVLELTDSRILAHVDHVARRQASVAFGRAQGSPDRLDLTRLIPAANAAQEQRTRAVLGRIARRPAPVWLTAIQKASQGERDPGVRQALAACAAEIERVGSAGRPADWRQQARERFEKRFSRALLRQGGRNTASVLPKALPALPASNDPRVTALIARRGNLRTTTQKVAALEREAAALLGSIKPKDRARGEALRSYLTAYKAGWAPRFIAQTLATYDPKPSAIGWKLTDQVTYKNGVTGEQQREIETRLEQAWSITRGVVNPKLLAWLPRLKVQVDAHATVAHHAGDVIKLRPDSSVGDILHELGHHIEDFGGLRPFSAVHAVLARRAYGSAMEPLRGIDPAGVYGSGELGYRGAFSRAYMGKRYDGGSTELLSTVLEELATPQRAQKFFERDGDHFLQLLHAVQRRPWPQVD